MAHRAASLRVIPLVLFAALACLNLAGCAKTPQSALQVEWERTLAGSIVPLLHGDSVHPTADGGYIVSAKYEQPEGCYRWLLIKTDSDGVLSWVKALGTDQIDSVQPTSDGGVVFLNRFPGPCRLLKTDRDGNVEWETTFEADCFSVEQTSDGGYILVGGYGRTMAIRHTFGTEDVWVGKVNSGGSLQWEQTFGGHGDQCGTDIHQTSDGGYILVVCSGCNSPWSTNGGNSLAKVNSTGNVEWDRSLGNGNLFSVGQTADGGYIAVGRQFSSNGDMAWLTKTGSDGNVEWDQTFGKGELHSVRQASDGGYVVVGYKAVSAEHSPVWLIGADSGGSPQWDKTWDSACSLQQTSDEEYIVLGNRQCGTATDTGCGIRLVKMTRASP